MDEQGSAGAAVQSPEEKIRQGVRMSLGLVQQTHESESGQMVSKKVKWALSDVYIDIDIDISIINNEKSNKKINKTAQTADFKEHQGWMFYILFPQTGVKIAFSFLGIRNENQR